MNSREFTAKHLVESIIKDLNANHGMKLFIQHSSNDMMLNSKRICNTLSIRYPNEHMENGSFALITIKDPTYVKLLNALIKCHDLTYYGTNRNLRIPVDISKMYGSTIDEIHASLCKNI